MQSQTTMSIAKLSCEIWALLGYYAAQSGDSLQTLDNLSVPSSKVKKSKERTAQLKFTHTIFFFFFGGGGVFVKHLLVERSTFQKPALFLFSNKEAPNLVYSLE
jgi:hypothetical protein